MIDSLRSYPDMKPSGLAWLGNVPAHWDVRRIKTLLREVDSRTRTGEERLLSLRMRQGLVDHIDAGGKPIPTESLVNFKIVKPGQVVMNRMRAAAGLFGVARVHGLVSPDYAVFEPKPGAYVPFLLEAFRMPSLAAVFRQESKGLGTGESGFLRLYTDRFGPIPILYPPLDEQRLIVRFLDWHGAQTAKLIRAKKKTIALLNEQKQAIIHRAVTRGLDPNVRLKPSGIPWLGDVPEGWELKRFKFLTKIRSGQIDPRLDTYKWQILIAPNHIQKGTSKLLYQETAINQGADSGKYKVNTGDIVYSKIRPALRKAIIAEFDGLCSADMYPISIIENQIDPKFLLLIMLSDEFTKYAIDCSMRVAMPKINREALGDFWVSFPTREMQSSIIDWISGECSQSDQLIEYLEREIALIQEFRSRLIADVVTGKLDVRAIAATLPDLAEDQLIEDAIDEDDFDEQETENEEVAA